MAVSIGLIIFLVISALLSGYVQNIGATDRLINARERRAAWLRGER